MKHPHCPSCQQDQYVIKSWFNPTRSQRYRYQTCQRYFTPDPQPEGDAQALRRKALRCTLMGKAHVSEPLGGC